MSATVFENNLDIEVHLTLNGRLKAVLSPGDTIAIDVPPAGRVGYRPAGYSAPARPVSTFSPPAVIPAASSPASVPALVRGHGAFRPEAAKAARPVTQYQDGVKVQTLRSVQAASRVAGVQYYDFLKALQAAGESGYTHDGFCYKYAAPGEQPCSPDLSGSSTGAVAGEKRRRNSGKAVVQMALDGTPLRVWPSQAIAADTLGINSSSISKVCHAQWETAGGFRWKLAKAA